MNHKLKILDEKVNKIPSMNTWVWPRISGFGNFYISPFLPLLLSAVKSIQIICNPIPPSTPQHFNSKKSKYTSFHFERKRFNICLYIFKIVWKRGKPYLKRQQKYQQQKHDIFCSVESCKHQVQCIVTKLNQKVNIQSIFPLIQYQFPFCNWI